MNVYCPSNINIDNGSSENFSVGDSVCFELKQIVGVIQKVGKTYVLIEYFNEKKDKYEVLNVPKNKCFLESEAEV